VAGVGCVLESCSYLYLPLLKCSTRLKRTCLKAPATPGTRAVLAAVLRNGFLHQAIREQGGAYGGGANQDSANACFKFFSYRDPRLGETLDDFEQAIHWLLEGHHEYQALEEAILGVISSLDKPASPAGDAKQTFHNELFGRTTEQRLIFRQQILAVSMDDLVRVTKHYLLKQICSVAVVTSHEHEQACRDLGLTIFNLG